jgi:hypothetical protein
MSYMYDQIAWNDETITPAVARHGQRLEFFLHIHDRWADD